METSRILEAQRDRVVVARMPAEIDIANGEAVSRVLQAVLRPGQVVVADMTGTRFCDCSGVRAILRAREQAAACGAEVRLALSAPLVRLVFKITEVDRLVSISPDVAAAAGRPAEAPGSGTHPQRRREASIARV